MHVSHKFKRLKNFEFFKPLDPTALNETARQYNDNRLTFSSIFYLLILKITLKLLLDAHQLGPELKLNENMVFLKFNKYLSLSWLQNPKVKNFDFYHIHFIILIKIKENSLIMVLDRLQLLALDLFDYPLFLQNFIFLKEINPF